MPIRKEHGETMQIIIEGVNRTEFCKPKTKDIDVRRFFETRGMLYRAYPDQLIKMRVYQFGVETGSDEVIVYPENGIHPLKELGTPIDMDKLLADCDANKNITGISSVKKPWGKLSSKTMNKLWAAFPMIMVGVVLLYAVASNGWQF